MCTHHPGTAREHSAGKKGVVPTSWAPHEQEGVAAGCPMPYTPHGCLFNFCSGFQVIGSV
eukprot:COSAG05_NODE_204_length_14187_cov_99.887422_9_plen_60_part_00